MPYHAYPHPHLHPKLPGSVTAAVDVAAIKYSIQFPAMTILFLLCQGARALREWGEWVGLGGCARLSHSTIRFVSECHFLFRIFAFYLLHLREHCCCCESQSQIESESESFVRYVLHSTSCAPHRRCLQERDRLGERETESGTPLTIHVHVHVGMYIWASCPCSGAPGLGQWESRKLPADLAHNFFHFYLLPFPFSFAISFVTHAISSVLLSRVSSVYIKAGEEGRGTLMGVRFA